MATLDIKDAAGDTKVLDVTEVTTGVFVPNYVVVNTSGTAVGVATEAKQDTQIAALGAAADAEASGNGSAIAILKRLRTLLGGTLTVSGTVSVSDVATSANQDTTNTRLGNTTDAEASGDGSLIAIAKRLRTLLGGLLGVTPQMSSAGHIDAQTNATGTNWTAFGSQACKQMLISNQTGVSLEVRHGGSGVGVRIPTGAMMPFYGLTNANQLEVRRVDTSNTQVTVQARWES
jgi:hypothetical protein